MNNKLPMKLSKGSSISYSVEWLFKYNLRDRDDARNNSLARGYRIII